MPGVTVKYFANSEKSDTFAYLNLKAQTFRAEFQFRTPVPTEKSATSPDGGIGRRAGLKHQWSNPCRFDPGSGYPLNRKSLIFKDLRFFLLVLYCHNEDIWNV